MWIIRKEDSYSQTIIAVYIREQICKKIEIDVNFPLYVQVGGMMGRYAIREGRRRLEKERVKEGKKYYPTMPYVIFSYYRVRKTGGKGKHFLQVQIIFNKMACHLTDATGQRVFDRISLCAKNYHTHHVYFLDLFPFFWKIWEGNAQNKMLTGKTP